MEEVAAGACRLPVVRADAWCRSNAYAPVRLALRGAHQVAQRGGRRGRVLELLDGRGSRCRVGRAEWGWNRSSGRDGSSIARLPGRARSPAGRRAQRRRRAGAPRSPRDGAATAARVRRHARQGRRGDARALAPVVSAFVMTRASNARSSEPSSSPSWPARQSALRSRGASPRPARRSRAWRLSPRIVVAGSIFLLGDVMKELSGRDTLGPCAHSWRSCAMLARSRRRVQAQPPRGRARSEPSRSCRGRRSSVDENIYHCIGDVELTMDDTKLLRRRGRGTSPTKSAPSPPGNVAVHPGQQPHRGRSRRVQHRDAARHVL